LPQKCTFCAHLLDRGWAEPRCVEACPTGAIAFGDLDDPDSEVSKRLISGRATPLHTGFGIGEKVSYIGIPKRFIAGSVVFGDNDRCAENVTVTITGNGEKRTAITNNFGDFEVEDLAENTAYTVSLEHPGYRTAIIETTTRIDVYLGDIILPPVES